MPSYFPELGIKPTHRLLLAHRTALPPSKGKGKAVATTPAKKNNAASMLSGLDDLLKESEVGMRVLYFLLTRLTDVTQKSER